MTTAEAAPRKCPWQEPDCKLPRPSGTVVRKKSVGFDSDTSPPAGWGFVSYASHAFVTGTRLPACTVRGKL